MNTPDDDIGDGFECDESLRATASAIASQRTRRPAPAVRGEVLGGGHPDWPEDLQSFSERAAYQRGVADARRVAAEAAQPVAPWGWHAGDGTPAHPAERVAQWPAHNRVRMRFPLYAAPQPAEAAPKQRAVAPAEAILKHLPAPNMPAGHPWLSRVIGTDLWDADQIVQAVRVMLAAAPQAPTTGDDNTEGRA